MKLIDVRAHKLKDRRFDNWVREVQGRWKIGDLRADPGYCNDWISFVSLAWHEESKRLYLGLTCINNDILYCYSPAEGSFRSLGFQRVADDFDAKLHRSLEIAEDGMIYVATALLHDVDQQHEALGGKLVRYDPTTDLYKILAIPVPRHYIQSIILDRQRRIIYGYTYPGEYLFRYDLETHQTRSLAFIGNALMACQSHGAALDKRGQLWGTWGESRAFEEEVGPVPVRIFRYDPDKDRFTWFQHGFPRVNDGDPARVDEMMLGDDGFIYAGTAAGGLSRLDPETGTVEDLGKPFPGPRLAGLCQGSDGVIYGAGNSGYDKNGKGTARLFSFTPRTRKCVDLGPIVDEGIGDGATKVHKLVVAGDGTLFAGENDNILRASYLWECRLA